MHSYLVVANTCYNALLLWVLRINIDNVLKPDVLDFSHNEIHELARTGDDDGYHIKDIMKTMDNRTVIDKELLKKYSEMLEKKKK